MVETFVTSQSSDLPLPVGKVPGTKRCGRHHLLPLYNTIDYSQRFTNISRDLFPSSIPYEESNISDLEDSFTAPLLGAEYLDLYTRALQGCDGCEGYTEFKDIFNIKSLSLSTVNTSPPSTAKALSSTPSPELAHLHLVITLWGVGTLDVSAIKTWEDVTSSHVTVYFNLT